MDSPGWPPDTDAAPLRWDLFCRVVDNLGDVGVSWRLARGLALAGDQVRLWIDEPEPLAWMAPGGEPGVQCLRWTTPWHAPDGPGAPYEPADVVVEAFGCDLPDAVLSAMAARARCAARAPLWLDLEYLSAEPWVARSHALPSPQFHGPAAGLTRWFFFPGFSSGTGGLLREPGLLHERAGFQRDDWLAALGLARRAGEHVLVVFCYDPQPALPQLPAACLDAAGGGGLLVLLTPGAAQQLGARVDWPPGTRVHALPWFSQQDFDRLLWSADLATVRGEDSLVRAIWAGVPFLWQAYAQADGAHAAKVEAMLETMAPAEDVAATLRAAWRTWNGTSEAFSPSAGSRPDRAGTPLRLPALAPWRAATQAWRERLAAVPDLVSQLRAFARTHRPRPG